MLSKARRAAPDIDRDINDCAAAHAHELALRAWRQLVMEAPHCAGTRIANVVVLDKNRADPAAARPCAFHTSEKKPRWSPMRRGTTILTSGNRVSTISIMVSSTARNDCGDFTMPFPKSEPS